MNPLFIDRESAASLAGLAVSTMEEMIRNEEFPAPRKISPKRVGWLLREIQEWAESRPVSNFLPPRNTSRKASGAA